jgi:hypothetical protein
VTEVTGMGGMMGARGVVVATGGAATPVAVDPVMVLCDRFPVMRDELIHRSIIALMG